MPHYASKFMTLEVKTLGKVMDYLTQTKLLRHILDELNSLAARQVVVIYQVKENLHLV